MICITTIEVVKPETESCIGTTTIEKKAKIKLLKIDFAELDEYHKFKCKPQIKQPTSRCENSY